MRDELLDSTLDGWRLLIKIGQGATGSVYEGRRGGERAAIKVIRPEVVAPASVSRFRREAELLRELDHPNVVRCVASGETDEYIYLALEFLDGGSLDRQLKRRERLPVPEAVYVLRALLHGLGAIHEKGIVHRDVKPGNVLLTRDGRVRLGDFNLARGDGIAEHDVTTTGSILGTPYYMAPEQVDGKGVSPQTDLYAAGALLYHLVTGDPPFDGSTPLQILQKHMHAEVPDLRQVLPDAPPQLARAVQTLMAKTPKQRPKNAAKARALLDGLEEAPLQIVRGAPRRAAGARSPGGAGLGATAALPPLLERTRDAPAPSGPLAAPLPAQRAELVLAASAPALRDEAPSGGAAAPEAAPPAGPRPLPRVPRSLLLDALVALLVFVAAAHLWDRWMRARGFDPLAEQQDVFVRLALDRATDWKRHLHPLGLGAFRGLHALRDALDRWWIAIPWSFGLVFLLSDLLLARLWRLGLLGRLWLRRQALVHLSQGKIQEAARTYELLGKRRKGADLLLAHGMPLLAAEMYAAAGLFEEQGRALLAAGRDREALTAFKSSGSVEAVLHAARLGDASPEAAELLAARGHLDEAIEAHRRGGRHFEAAKLLEAAERRAEAAVELERGYERQSTHDCWVASGQQVPLEEAKFALARRVAALHTELGDLAAAGRWRERAGDFAEAAELFAQAGDVKGQARCALAALPQGKRPAGRLAELATEAAHALRERREPKGIDLLLRLGEVGAAAELARDLGDDPQAAQLFARAGRQAEGAACAERAGNRQLAAFLYDEGGAHADAARVYRELGLLPEAADAAERAQDFAALAELREQLGDALGAARALKELGRREEALDLLSRVREEEGEERWRAARALTGELQFAAGRWAQAAEALADGTYAEVEEPDDVAPNLMFAECLERLERYDAALAVLDRFADPSLAPPDLEQRRARLTRLAAEAASPRPTIRASASRVAAGPPPGSAPPPLRDPAELEGRALAGWDLEQALGDGPFVWAFGARARAGERREAVVKVLRPELTTPHTAAPFLAAAEALRGARSRHLVEVYEAGEAEGLVFVATEAVRGPNLNQVIASEAPLPLRRACLLTAGALNGLAAAHRSGLVHLDLKPSRVLVGRGSAAKVVDAGVAPCLGDALTERLDPRYVSPEQARREPAGAAADQYLAALLLYKLLTGKLPFSSKTPRGFWELHAAAPPTPLGELRPDVPRPLLEAVHRALAKHPRERFPDVGALERIVASYLR